MQDNATEHRKLRFSNVDDCVMEVERIAEADRQGTLRTTGNWTAGQIMAHPAEWIEYGYEGFPLPPPPWLVRWFLRLRLKKILRSEMPRGVRIPRVEGGTVGADPMETQEAAERLVRALRRLESDETVRYDSPAFGAMSHEDRIQLNLRHAELHLGFLQQNGVGSGNV